jgi:hypothetical protein
VLACDGDEGPSTPPPDAAVDASATGGISGSGGVRGSGGTPGAASGGAQDASSGSPGSTDAASDAAQDGSTGSSARDCGAARAADPDAGVATYCSAIVQAACLPWLDFATCRRIAATRFGQAPPCCQANLERLIDCAGRHQMRCASLSDDVLFPPECAAIEEEWNVCMGSGDNCTSDILASPPDGGVACRVECDQYAADCSRTGDELTCTCTFGPRSGHAFAVPSCDDAAIAAACK